VKILLGGRTDGKPGTLAESVVLTMQKEFKNHQKRVELTPKRGEKDGGTEVE